MRKINLSGRLVAAVLSALCLMMTACTGTAGNGPVNNGSGNNTQTVTDNTDDGAGTGNDAQDATDTADGSDSQGTGDENQGGEAEDLGMGDDVFTHVSDVDSFLEAIQPGARIKIEPGYYNLTEYITGAIAFKGYEEWNDEHKYVKIRENFDGPEVVIQDSEGLIIEGGSDKASDTEIVIEPRYSSVLVFIGSDDIEISNITMGHTETGECVGDVLDFQYCKNIHINNVDLYGCGVYAIGCDNSTGNLYVADSVLRDCSGGSLSIYSPEGEFVFDRCTFTGSNWGGYYDSLEGSSLVFNNCKFGQQESNTWYFNPEVVLNDCDLMEPTYYPEYGDYEEE